MSWPVAEVDRVARLRALAAGLPHIAWVEGVIEAPFDRVWAVAGDMEHGVPRFESHVRSVRILSRDGESLRLVARVGRLGLPVRLDVLLRPGWCVMRGRFSDIGMAAVDTGDGRTRFAHFEGLRGLRAVSRQILGPNLPGELERLEALARGS